MIWKAKHTKKGGNILHFFFFLLFQMIQFEFMKQICFNYTLTIAVYVVIQIYLIKNTKIEKYNCITEEFLARVFGCFIVNFTRSTKQNY